MSETDGEGRALPRRRVVRDPVHDYVVVPGELDALVSSPAVQRLRGVSQTARASTRYPSLTGSRYEHALGTMHLAAEGWQHAWRNCDAEVQQHFARAVVGDLRDAAGLDACTARWVAGASVEETAMWHDFPRVVGLAVAAVGLVHDLGHPPFSHILEGFYLARVQRIMGPDAIQDQARYAALADHTQFHEWAGLRIFDSLPDDFFEHLPRELVRLVLSDRSGDRWTACLHSITDGQFDVDRLDYLMRDGLQAGTELGSIDARRLVESLELHRVAGGWRIGLGARAISAFETMLVQRAQQYRWVVHHHAAVAADAALSRCAEGIFDLATRVPADVPAREPLVQLASVLPDLDYVDVDVGKDPDHWAEVCRDDADLLSWFRASRRPLSELARSAEGELATTARRLLRLHDMCDGAMVEPVPAWRNYHEYLARAEQNPDEVAALVERASSPSTPDFLTSPTSRQAAATMLTELPARLNTALQGLIDDRHGGVRRVEQALSRSTPDVDGLGPGFWLVEPVRFHALRDEFATVWRGNEEAPLSAVSPFPLALTAIEVMRPSYFAYFVPFEAPSPQAGKDARRAVGRAFLRGLTSEPQPSPAD